LRHLGDKIAFRRLAGEVILAATARNLEFLSCGTGFCGVAKAHGVFAGTASPNGSFSTRWLAFSDFKSAT